MCLAEVITWILSRHRNRGSEHTIRELSLELIRLYQMAACPSTRHGLRLVGSSAARHTQNPFDNAVLVYAMMTVQITDCAGLSERLNTQWNALVT